MGTATSTPNPTFGNSNNIGSGDNIFLSASNATNILNNTSSSYGGGGGGGGHHQRHPSTSSSTPAPLPSWTSNDPLASHIAKDLPRHIIERRFGPSSGRLIRSYRLRHVDSGALVVLKAMMVRIEIRSGNCSHGVNAAAIGESYQSQLNTKGIKTYFGTMTQQELSNQDEQLQKILETLLAQTNTTSNPEANTTDDHSIPTLAHPNILPFYHWFASSDGIVITNTNRGGGILLPSAFMTQPHSQQHATISFGGGGNNSAATATIPTTSTDSTTPSSLVIIEKPIYLLRPHVYSTLYDRMQSRPFLTCTEKMFIAFQILKAIHSLHQCRITNTFEENRHNSSDNTPIQYPCCHGHITCENVGLTSWNWVTLLDIAPPSPATKPICIPDDDPSDFISYFQEQGYHPYSSSSSTTNTSSSFPFSDPTTILPANILTNASVSGGGVGSSGGDKRCYLAPERFYTKAKYTQDSVNNKSIKDLPTRLTPAMDIFSLGCVFIELFLNGERAFDLGDLMEYRKKNGVLSDLPSLQQKLNKIESSAMRAACRHMLQIDPSKRLSAGEYLDLLTRSSISANPPFPQCFENILFPFLQKFRCELFSPDGRIAMALLYYGKIIHEILGSHDVEGENYFRKIIGFQTSQLMESQHQLGVAFSGNSQPTSILNHFPSLSLRICDPFRNSQIAKDELLFAQTDQLLREIETTYFTPRHATSPSSDKIPNTSSYTTRMDHKDGPSSESNMTWTIDKLFFRKSINAGALTIFLQFVLSTFRHCQRPSSKVIALQLILRLASYCDDEDRLQRIVPGLVATLQDSDASVRATSVTALSSTMTMVRTFPPSDARIFPQYIFKRVSTLVSDPVLLVRIAFTESIGLLAETALRFLNTCHAVAVYEAVEVDKSLMASTNATGSSRESPMQSVKSNQEIIQSSTISNRGIKNAYDKEVIELREFIARWVVLIATDSGDLSTIVKQSLLNDIARLCDFFGQEGVMAYILPQVLAFLNERKDWRLRASLCEHLPTICAVLGRAATEQFVVPIVETALVDEEDLVISSALNCLGALVELGLVTRGVLLGTRRSTRMSTEKNVSSGSSGDTSDDLNKKMASSCTQSGIIKKYAPLLMHPCADVRLSAAALISSACRLVGFPDDEIILLPLFRPFLRHDISRFKLKAPGGILSCVMPPLCSLKNKDKIETELERIKLLLRNAFGLKSERYLLECLQGINSYYDMLPLIMKTGHLMGSHIGRVLTEYTLDLLPRNVFTCFIPDQRHVEAMADPPPMWYTSIHQILSSRSQLNRERSFLKSMSTLRKIYGININQQLISGNFQRRWKGDMSDGDFNLPLCSGEEEALSESQLELYLSSCDAQLYDATLTGEWGASALTDPAYVENNLLYISKVAALQLPPLPPRLGIAMLDDDRRHRTFGYENGQNQKFWKPKVDSLVSSSIPGNDHVGPVVKLAVSYDYSYFVSGGSDGRVSVWETRQLLENDGCLKSQIFYSHIGDKSSSPLRINDLNIIENSRSVFSAASDGSLNVWRIDCLDGRGKPVLAGGDSTTNSGNSVRVSGSTLVRKLSSSEGEIVASNCLVTPSGSVITFASQRGYIHSWDLRSEHEPFTFQLFPELGLICSMAVGRDHSILTGTKKGFLALWDIRFQKLVKLWRHSNESPITCLRAGFSPEPTSRPNIAMSCGHNEATIFDLLTGNSLICTRTLDQNFHFLHQSELPVEVTSPPKLSDILIPSAAKRHSHTILDWTSRTPSFEAFTALISTYSPPNQTHFITGGHDGWIRFWDFISPSKSFNVCGPKFLAQPRSVYERVEATTAACNTIICRHWSSTEYSLLTQQRGPLRAETGHSGSILDLITLESPLPILISCSGDGSIKAWK